MTKHLLWLAIFQGFSIATAQDPIPIQAATVTRPKFEITSVKECKPSDQTPPSTSSPGRLSLGCWQLWRLIADAYETFSDGTVDPLKLGVGMPLDGGPMWVNSARYTIDAKAEGPERAAMMRGPMMQALLEDRFHLKVRRETREISAYFLTVAQDGPKLKPTEEGSCNHADPTDLTLSARNPPNDKPWCLNPAMTSKGGLTTYDVHGMTLDVFAKLFHPGGRPVINRTGLAGAFEIHLQWAVDDPGPSPDGSTAADPPGTSMFAAIRRQLGLQLDPGKGSREFLVIDHIERPTEN